MSGHAAFRRQPVPGQMALQHQTATLPAPIRGIVETENWAYTKPGCANVIDNWYPTQKGLRIRGGTERWLALPGYPEAIDPIYSGFEYISGAVQRMFVVTAAFKMYDVTFADTPTLVTGMGTITNANFSATQFANQGGDFLLAVNDAGDYVRRYNGTTGTYLTTTTPTAWAISTAYAVNARALDTADNTRWKCLVGHTSPGTGTFAAARTAAPTQWTRELAADGSSYITGPPGTTVENGHGLTYVWKYRSRLFFIEGGTMNAWCLPVNAVGGELVYIPLSGAAKKGGSLLFGASWSTDSGDGNDDKNCFFTDQGEVIIFVGTDPTSSLNWKQDGRYDISKPLGKNAHQQLGGDVLVATVDGVVPLSAAVQKDVSALSLAAITYNIEPMWMREFRRKNFFPWSIAKWDEGDLMFVNFPGGAAYNTKTVAVSNLHTGAWSRFVGWDAMCFMQINGKLFFGTQDGTVMLAESTGFDDAHEDENEEIVGNSYVCRMVGGWEVFQTPPSQVTWFQARASFFSAAREPFEPQLAATTDYEFRIPPPPNVGPDPGPLDVWDQGIWGPDKSSLIAPDWLPATPYTAGTRVHDAYYGYFDCAVAHTSAAVGTFAEDRAAHPTYWTLVDPQPVYPPMSVAEKNAYAQWDQPSVGNPAVRNTMWVSIGETGFSHAPICQVSIGQQFKPDVELIAISATFLRMGANV